MKRNYFTFLFLFVASLINAQESIWADSIVELKFESFSQELNKRYTNAWLFEADTFWLEKPSIDFFMKNRVDTVLHTRKHQVYVTIYDEIKNEDSLFRRTVNYESVNVFWGEISKNGLITILTNDIKLVENADTTIISYNYSVGFSLKKEYLHYRVGGTAWRDVIKCEVKRLHTGDNVILSDLSFQTQDERYLDGKQWISMSGFWTIVD